MSPAPRRAPALAPSPGWRVVLIAAVIACGCAPRRASVVGPTRIWRPVRPEAYAAYLRGRLAALGGELERAAAAFERASQLAPEEPEPVAAHIEILARANHAARAAHAAADAQQRWPRSAAIFSASGAAAYRAGAYADAARAYARAIALAPDRERPYLRLAQSLKRVGEFERELATYRALLDRRPRSTRGSYRLGVRLAERARHAEAERWLRTALELEPDHLAARVELARLLGRTGRPQAGLAALREAFDRTGASARGARRILRRVRKDGAAATIAAARALDRDDLAPAIRVQLGEAMLAEGAVGAAIALADRVLATDPEHADARRLRALAVLRWLAES